MSSVDKVSNSTFQQIKEVKQQPIKPNNMENKPDKTELSTKKKVQIGAAVTGLLSAAVGLVYMIGRNPAKAAKVLKGNSNFAHEAYEKGNKIAEELFSKNPTMEKVMGVFKRPEHPSNLNIRISELEKYMKEKNIAADSEIGKTLQKLKQNLQEHLNNVEQRLVQGESVSFELNQAFVDKNRKHLNLISDYLKKDGRELESYFFEPHSAVYDVGLNGYIKQCPQEVLPNNGIFFHGTRKAGKVYKTGFTPFASNQIETAGRELGAGIYITPDARVAASFSGLGGSIIPLKLAQDAKIAMVTEDTHKYLFENVGKYIQEQYGAEAFEKLPQDVRNAATECFIRNVFKQAGYDAAYIPKGVKGGGGILGNILNPDINEFIGRNQKQVVVFSPEKLEIAPRTFTERVGDLKDKFGALRDSIKWQKEHPYGF